MSNPVPPKPIQASKFIIPASQHENAAIAGETGIVSPNICYKIARYHVCGHPLGTTSLLLSSRHIQQLGYGNPCNSACSTDSSRRWVSDTRCAHCVAVEECFLVSLKHTCGHLFGQHYSRGPRHVRLLDVRSKCDAYCRTVQMDQGVGGFCAQCNWPHCCMIWERYACGHRGAVVTTRLVSSRHILDIGSEEAPCEAQCQFRHKERMAGAVCPKCIPLTLRSKAEGKSESKSKKKSHREEPLYPELHWSHSLASFKRLEPSRQVKKLPNAGSAASETGGEQWDQPIPPMPGMPGMPGMPPPVAGRWGGPPPGHMGPLPGAGMGMSPGFGIGMPAGRGGPPPLMGRGGGPPPIHSHGPPPIPPIVGSGGPPPMPG
ncbi:hypothetical protein HD806DRAFT_527902 [Xylariaceae sp. AK1471]|nr:hypothetical protein HD806DRAFT_527902 [Xylariaceae sp. AK1471]